jgi:hypothetical protein
MDSCVNLAKQTIEQYIKTGEKIKPPVDLPKEWLEKKAGVFVSLHKKSDHSLRGCIGTFLPTQENIASEIIENAISSATHDPRFMPLTEKELANLEINVDVLSEPAPVKDIKELDPKKYGVIVKTTDGRAGLLLPDIGVETVNEQISICCQKGGISPLNDKLIIFKFTVERHK